MALAFVVGAEDGLYGTTEGELDSNIAEKTKGAQLITGSYCCHKKNVNEGAIVQPNVYPPQASPLREGELVYGSGRRL
jgi:hypothetical protein